MKMYLYPVLTEPNKHPNLPIGERPGQWIVHAPVHPTPSRWKDRRQAGFTLIELLVVLGVIALLASLILPALAMAKSSAQTAKCKSNIRQVGLGLKMYTDQEGELPPFHDCMARSGTNWWSSFLRPYTSSSWLDPLYQCPAYRGLTRDGGGSDRGNSCVVPPQGSYGINAQGLALQTPKTDKFLGLDGRTLHLHDKKSVALKEQIIRSPSQMIALGDANLTPALPGSVIFLGGFPASPVAAQIFAASGQGELNFYMGRLVVTHTGKADTVFRNCRQSTRQRHNDRFNLGFADGHIECLKTETLFSNRPDARSLWNNDNEPHPELLIGF